MPSGDDPNDNTTLTALLVLGCVGACAWILLLAYWRWVHP